MAAPYALTTQKDEDSNPLLRFSLGDVVTVQGALRVFRDVRQINVSAMRIVHLTLADS